MKHLRLLLIALGCLVASAAHAAMWASQNGAALYPLGGEGGSYTSCTKKALSSTNDAPALIGMECSAVNKAFGWRFFVPTGETPTTINVGLSVLGNAAGSQTGCFQIACGCCGDTTTERACANPTLGAASAMSITSSGTWDNTESKTFVVNSVALTNGGADRSCACRAVRLTGGSCATDNWNGTPANVLDVEAVEFSW